MMPTTTKERSRTNLELLLEPKPNENLPVVYVRPPAPQSPVERTFSDLRERFEDYPKIFSYVDPSDHSAEFEVLSDRWNWKVRLIEQADVAEIPEELRQALLFLLKSGLVSIDAAFIAFPIPHHTIAGVVVEETANVVQTSLTVAGRSLFVALSLAGVAASGLLSTISVTPAMPFKDPDPALLVRVQNTLIELGRWG